MGQDGGGGEGTLEVVFMSFLFPTALPWVLALEDLSNTGGAVEQTGSKWASQEWQVGVRETFWGQDRAVLYSWGNPGSERKHLHCTRRLQLVHSTGFFCSQGGLRALLPGLEPLGPGHQSVALPCGVT